MYLLGLGVIDVCAVAGDVGSAAVHLHTEMVLGDDFHRQTVFVNLDVRILPRSQNQLLLNLVAGDILMVQNTVHGVTSLFSKGEAAVLVLVEIHTPLHQLHHSLGGLADGQLHDVTVGKLVAGHHRVLNMLLVSVRLVDDGGDASLCIACGTVVHLRLCNHADFAEIGGLQCETQSGNTRTDHQKIYFFTHNLA